MRRPMFFQQAIAAAALLALSSLLAHAQKPAAGPGTAAAPLQTATVASLNDALLAKATSIYYSTAKSGLHSFDCQLHPDWNKIMASARKGAPVPADNPRLSLFSSVKITLHVRLNGGFTLDWQPPANPEEPLDQAANAMLDRMHHNIENTWQGLLKLWVPLVDGSLAESLGEDGAEISETADGYTLRSKDKAYGHTEAFDRNLVLKEYIVTEAGSTVSLAPAFQPTAHGLLLSSFDAHIQPAGAPAENPRQMRVAIEYQIVSGIEIPGRVNLEMPDVVQMNFALDGCTVNGLSK